jgi:aminotransferase
MSQTATRLIGLRESIIRDMTRLAIRHKAINMAQGFPDFPPPPEILAAAHRAIDAGLNQYTITWGVPELRRAISQRMADWYNLSYDPDQHITVTCGVSEAIISAVMGVVNPGEELIIIEPFHENYMAAAAFAGAKTIYLPLEPPDYQLDLDRLRRAFSPRAKAILFNTPHNPTGRVFTREEVEGVAQLCREFDVVAITDEIYDHILYDGRQHIPIATLDGMAERTITIGGLGKTFAVTGWRLGYACAPEPYCTALRTVHDFTTICAPTPLQHAAAAALQLPPAFYDQLRADYTGRRARMMAILDRFGFAAETPEGAYYVMSDFKGWDFDGDSHAFSTYLTTEVGVAVVPGNSFYVTPGIAEGTIRWAFAKKPETFDEVEARLARHS